MLYLGNITLDALIDITYIFELQCKCWLARNSELGYQCCKSGISIYMYWPAEVNGVPDTLNAEVLNKKATVQENGH
jgi:hypothetical protein